MNDTIRTLYDTILDRRDHPSDNSYTRYLFDQGIDKILKKVGEESAEVIIAAKNGHHEDTVGEIADLTYHLPDGGTGDPAGRRIRAPRTAPREIR